ncbi:hypothetical protein LCGC14_0825780 [marine sediment metagenome]|uniref:Uncharacterized protein n=1 Tax=marine sediment metagenome TaxID=412755 RepID=A0A0F9Q2T2_9ZZZZ
MAIESVLSDRLQLPLYDYIGPRSPGTIKTIEAGVFLNVDTRFPTVISDMLISYENSVVHYENGVVTV